MSHIKKYLLQGEDGGDSGGWGSASYGRSIANGSFGSDGSWRNSETSSPEYGYPSVPLTPTDVNSWGPVKNVTAPTNPNYGSSYGDYSLGDLFQNYDQDWGVPSVPLTPQTIESWGNVKEAQSVLGGLPSSEGIFGNSLNQEYGPDGDTLGFQTSPFGKKAVGVARSLANLNPYGRVANMGVDAYNGVSPLKIAANAIPGNLGLVSRMGADVAGGAGVGETVGKNVGGALGGWGAGGFTRGLLGNGLGGTLASMVAGQQGSQIGAQVGKQVANADTGTNMNSPFSRFAAFIGGDTTPGINPTAKAEPRGLPPRSPFEQGVTALGSLFAQHQAQQGAQQQQDALRSQGDILRQQQASMPSLESMYGPNSPYAQQLRQTLARQDAKAGRNSQYGPREAQLQALLADKASAYAAQQAQGTQSYNNAINQNNTAMTTLNDRRIQSQSGQLKGLFDLGEVTGINGAISGGLRSLYDYAAPAAYDWFKGAPEQSTYEEA